PRGRRQRGDTGWQGGGPTDLPDLCHSDDDHGVGARIDGELRRLAHVRGPDREKRRHQGHRGDGDVGDDGPARERGPRLGRPGERRGLAEPGPHRYGEALPHQASIAPVRAAGRPPGDVARSAKRMTRSHAIAGWASAFASGGGRQRRTALPTVPLMDALVRIDNVTKRYDSDGQPAVDGVSLEIAPGEAVAV